MLRVWCCTCTTTKDATEPTAQYELVQDADGVWEKVLPGNLHGTWYDYTVHGFEDPGNHFYESVPQHISDPYARVTDDGWGKCRVWEATTPAAPLANGRPAMEEVIAYEVHVQDFTDRLPLPDALTGTFSGMAAKGLRNRKGAKIGFDYLTELGINTVHLMPVQEYLHWPNADWQASFKDDPYMQQQGIALENYQWGYRTSHCFAIESRYRKGGTEAGEERNQFRDLVQAFHDKGIAVIIDIVPNHTAENMDGQSLFFHFNALDKQYYYRTKDLKHIGAYGNEVKTENRPMVQRWLIDQCSQLMEEFGIDGFRIDLAGQVDEQTLIALKKALPDDTIIYGEPWIGSNDPAFEANPDWDWYKADSPITFFQDDARNAFKGPVSNPNNMWADRGFAGGNLAMRDNVLLGLTNRFPTEDSPLDGINYLDIHDNWALADRFALNDWNGLRGVDEDRMKLAALLLYTSLGPIVTHGGTEIMRSKALAPLEEQVKETNDGVKVYLHGKRDTYNLRNANSFLWETVGTKTRTANFAAMQAFWQQLNQLRRQSGLFAKAEHVPENYYQFTLPENPALLGYIIDGKLAVVLNAGREGATFSGFALPAGNWKLIGNNSGMNISGVKDSRNFRNYRTGDFELPAAGFKVWMRE